MNIAVDAVNKESALENVMGFLQTGRRPHTVFAVNPEKTFSVPDDPVLHKVFTNADLLIPDGIGIVVAARLLYGTKLERVPGVEFMEEICNLAGTHDKKVFIYGSKEEVNKAAVEKLCARYPGLTISGRSHGYIPEEEMLDLIDRINRSRAEILFLALGSPKQERWFATYSKDLLHVRVCQGIGGTLDTIAGNVRRAPKIWQKYHLEWLYRLLAEPKRLKRQKVLPVFGVRIIALKLRMLLGRCGPA